MPEAAQTIALASNVSVAVAAAMLFGVARSVPSTPTSLRWSLAALTLGSIQLWILILWGFGIASALPMLTGFGSVASALLLGWPLLLPKPNMRWDLLLATLFGALLLALAAIVAVESLNTTSVPLDLWGFLGLVASFSVLLGLVLRRPNRWALFFIGYSLLFAGFAVGTWLVIGVLPLVEAILYPGMIAIVIRGLIQEAKLSESASPLAGFSQAVHYFETALQPEQVVFNGLRLITLSLRARYGLCFQGPDSSGVLTLRSAVDAMGVHEPSGPPLQGKALPGLVAAMAQAHAQVFQSERELKELREALKLDPAGPALVSPFSTKAGESGGLLLLADSQRPVWSQSELETFEAAASFLSNRVRKGPDTELEKQAEEIEVLRGELRLVLQELSEVGVMESRPSVTQVGTLTAQLSAMRKTISSILGYADMLYSSAAGAADPEQQQFIDHVQQDAESLDDQLAKLLELVAAPQDVVRSDVEISELVDIAASQVGTELQRSGTQLKREFSTNLPPVRVDPDILRQIIVLLLERAIEISPDGSQILVVAAADSEGWVSVAISDQGPGVPAEDLGRAFQGQEGALPRAKFLADSLGGRVWIGSEIGSGSTVTVLIPAS